MRILSYFALVCGLLLCSCNREHKLLTKGDMLFLNHKGASMPILVKGDFSSDAIILVVHGGAGAPAGTFARDLNPLEDEFAVAYWEQRHAGSSQGKFDPELLTIDQMSEDLELVIQLLKQQYGQDKKVFALAHSWGVQLSTYYMTHRENRFDGIMLVNGSHKSEVEYSARISYIKRFAQEMIDAGAHLDQAVAEKGVF